MELSAIKSKVAAAITHEQRTGALRQTLTQAMQAQGVHDEGSVEQLVGLIRAYVEQVPTALETVEQAGNAAGIADELRPILEHAERSFLATPGAIPDEAGLMGLTDNAYLLFQLFALVSGDQLSPQDLQAHHAIRGMLGEPVASQLDAIVQGVVASPEVQQALQRIAAHGTTAPASPAASTPTVGGAMVPSPGAAAQPAAARPSVVAVRTAPVAGSAEADVGTPQGDFPGAPDPTFGRGGRVVTNLQGGKARGMAIQSDGKIVVAGESLSDQGSTSVTIARYKLNGGLDTTFGGSGCVRLDMGGKDSKKQNGSAAGLALQPDGKVVIAGVSDSLPDEIGFKHEEWVIARLTTDGKLDASFAQSGWLQLRLGARGKAHALALQPDGKLIAAGNIFHTDQNYVDRNYLGLVRLLPDGRLDPEFGQGGIVGVEGPEETFALALQPDGKIVAVGTTSVGLMSTKITIVRASPSGALDAAFGDGGRLTIDFGGGDNKLQALTVQPDGKLVLTGTVQEGNSYQYVVTRLNPDGSFDQDFGTDGVITGRFPLGDQGDSSGGSCFAHALALQPDGKVLMAGALTLRSETTGYVGNMPYVVSDRTFSVARFSATGELDPTFGDGGVVNTNFGDRVDEAYAIALQADSKVVVAGASSRGVALVRYLNPAVPSVSRDVEREASGPAVDRAAQHAAGKLDPTFNEQGAAITEFAEGFAVARALCVQPDGQILLAGDVNTRRGETPIDFALARYNNDGTPDETFGTSGKALIDVSGTDDLAHAIALQSDGKIIVAGETLDQASNSLDFALVRLDPQGNVDPTFNGSGLSLTDFVGSAGEAARNSDDRAYAVAVQPDGKIVAAGYTTFVESKASQRIECFALARYNPDGHLDTGFGDKGRVITPFPSNFARIRALCIQPDGKVLATGVVKSGTAETPFNVAAARYQPDGALDESFGAGGLVAIDLPGTDDTAHAIALQSDGRIVIAGEAWDRATDRIHVLLLRLDSAGTLDTSFNGTGATLAQEFEGAAYGLAIQRDGKILVAGYVRTADQPQASGDARPRSAVVDHLLVARYTSDGDVDAAFGSGGAATVDFGGQTDRAFAVALQRDGKIVAAGTTADGDTASFVAVRLQNR